MTTTRATPAQRKTAKPKASFSIPAAQKEWDVSQADVEPFTVEMTSGAVITLRNPRDVGWQVLSSMDAAAPWQALQTVVAEDDLQAFYAEDFPAGIAEQMVKAYQEHYGVDASGE